MPLFQSAALALGSELGSGTKIAKRGIASLSNGNFAATLTSTSLDGLTQVSRTQIYDTTGSIVGSPVDQTVLDGKYVGDLFGLSNGGFIVAAIKDGGLFGDPDFAEPSYLDVFLSSFDGALSAATPEFIANVNRMESQVRPEFAKLSNGNIAVAWATEPGASISVRIFDQNLSPVTNEIRVGGFGEIDAFKIGLTSLSNGKFSLSWNQYKNAANLTDVVTRIYYNDGTPATAILTVNTEVTGLQRQFGSASLDGGRYAVGWYGNGGPGYANCQILNSDGTKYGPDFKLGASGSFDDTFELIGLGDGRFAFLEVMSANNKEYLRLWVYNTSGEACGQPVILDVASPVVPVTNISSVEMELLNADHLVIAWNKQTEDTGDIVSVVAKARIFDLSKFTGTAANDKWVGGRLGETMTGGEGADSFYGMGGVDNLMGGAGDDILSGGTSGDVLNGSIGSDTASYLGGSAVTVSLTNPLANLGAAKGDAFISIENLAGSASGDVLKGDGKANRLTGNAGADVLYGLAGNDTLQGGLGADRLNGGEGADRFVYASRSEGGDLVYGFDATDYFVFTSAAIWHLPAGTLKQSNFVARKFDNHALDADDYFIFRQSDDTLWFDPDGSKAAAPVKMADLTTNFDLKATDILII
jgi:Ca2+-binding RTX toxin-like protein